MQSKIQSLAPIFIRGAILSCLAVGGTLAVSAASPIVYFADSSTSQLSGGATIGTAKNCGSGFTVQNLGGPKRGAVTLKDINADAAGTYQVTVVYGNGRTYDLPASLTSSVGSMATVSLPPTGAWGTMHNATGSLQLAQGSNSIRISGVNNGWAAEICSLSLVATQATPPPAPNPIPSPVPPGSPTPPVPPSNSVSLLSFGNAGQGGDDTATFQQGLNGTASAQQTLRVPAGTYNVQPLHIPSNSHLFLDPGAIVQATAVGYNAIGQVMLDLSGASNVTVTGTPGQSVFRMQKAQYTDGSEYRHCLNIVQASNVTVSGISCNDSGGDGVYVNASQGVTLTASTFNNNSRNGMSVIGATHLLVDGCTFSNTVGNANRGSAPDGPWAGIDIEPNGTGDTLQDITIQNTTVSGNGTPLPSGNGLCSHCGAGVKLNAGVLGPNSGSIGILLNNITSKGNAGSGYFFDNEGGSQGLPSGLVTLQNSTSSNDGQWGIVAYFWDYAPNAVKLTALNNTIVNPMQGYNTLQPLQGAALAVTAGGGDNNPAGNIEFRGTTIRYNGKSGPAYFDVSPYNRGGMANITVDSFGATSGLSSGSPFGLLQDAPANSVNIP